MSDKLPSIDNLPESELPSVDQFITEEQELPSIEDFIENPDESDEIEEAPSTASLIAEIQNLEEESCDSCTI